MKKTNKIDNSKANCCKRTSLEEEASLLESAERSELRSCAYIQMAKAICN